MNILIIADVHHCPDGSAATLKKIKKAVEKTKPHLAVLLGDTVGGPDTHGFDEYQRCLNEVLDCLGDTPFAFVFGNHDDECETTKDQILSVVNQRKNSLTKGRDYVLNIMGETLIFIDSGSYYDGDGSLYDTVKQSQIDFALENSKGEKGILFQHIIFPDIMDCIDEREHFAPFFIRDGKKWYRFKKGIVTRGLMLEKPCPPDINTGELKSLSPYLKGAVFGHDHKNDFELTLKGVKLIQCPGSGSNSYDKYMPSALKLLDTVTMTTKKIYI